MFRKIFKIISVIFIMLITCAVLYVGYNGKTSIEIPKGKPNFDLSSKIHLTHFQNNNLSVEEFKQSMFTYSPKIYVFGLVGVVLVEYF